MGLYSRIYTTVLARFDAELCHEAALRALRLAGSSGLLRLLRARFSVEDERLAVQAMGLTFPNPLGLAAGFDKNGVAVPGLACLGFGFIEVGTVTPHPQAGNPKPRLFRLPEDGALINRLGFPNAGAEALRRNLQRRRHLAPVPVGASVGKGRETPIERASEDYCRCLTALYEHADYFALNVSSPNTPELRRLHDRALFERLVRTAVETGNELSRKAGCRPKPLLAKISPDIDLHQLEAALEVAVQYDLSGVIATNTTVARDGLTHPKRSEVGGLSGRPLRDASTRMIREIRKRVGDRLLIIGCGGITSADDAWEKLAAGATLLQGYTGFIYEGPSFARKVSLGLLRLMEKHGVSRITEVVGSALKDR